MADRGDVMTWLEICGKHREDCSKRCPFLGNPWCREDLMADALELLKEQEAVVRCEDCVNWIPGYITNQDEFIPPKCGKYRQMVGHSYDDFCSLAEKKGL